MRSIKAVAAIVAGLALSAIVVAETGDKPASPTTAPTTQAAAAPINKFCPLNPENTVDPAVTTVYDGKTIGFCCPDCIPDFKKDPAKYMKTLK